MPRAEGGGDRRAGEARFGRPRAMKLFAARVHQSVNDCPLREVMHPRRHLPEQSVIAVKRRDREAKNEHKKHYRTLGTGSNTGFQEPRGRVAAPRFEV